jgi:hypothetical protein
MREHGPETKLPGTRHQAETSAAEAGAPPWHGAALSVNKRKTEETTMSILSRNFTACVFLAGTVCCMAGFAATARAEWLIVNGIYQESSNTTTRNAPTPGSCNNTASSCDIVFAKVPVGKQLTVTHVSCELYVSAGEVSQLFLYPIRPNGTAHARYQWLTSSTRPDNLFAARVVVNQAAYQLFNQKDFPTIRITMTENSQVGGWCSITGPLTEKP